jgi:uncharacterized glyoxalase superfamily protein PhnB
VGVIPALRYREADRAIEWLKQALGFCECAVYRDDKGTVIHAELDYGNGMIMLGTAGANTQTADWYRQPDEAGGLTASVYLLVRDCMPVYESARAANAEFVQDLETKDYGGKAFTVRDPEGQIWSVGEYNPWQKPKS